MLRTYRIVFFCLAAFVMAGCGSIEESPTAPTPLDSPAPAPAPEPAPAPAPAPAPSGPGVLSIAISPNPVSWSSENIPGCSLPNTWRYDQTLTNTGGSTITISDRADSFDGVQVSTRSGLGIVLEPGAEHKLQTRWCSANSTEHRAQTTFSGSDASGNRINVAGPVVRLAAR